MVLYGRVGYVGQGEEGQDRKHRIDETGQDI